MEKKLTGKKLIALSSLCRKLKQGRKGKRVVFTNGCFDVLHAGHVRYLKKAKELGDILIVGLNNDSSVKKIKGRGRPVLPEAERAEILVALEAVDYVVLFKEATPEGLIKKILPDVLVKGADWKAQDIVGADVVKAAGGKVARVRLVKGKSTTNIIEKIRKMKKP
ncbi:MAG: D-glycero-beta-D-manno-heptose 1-phosphate adenylyltransferase [Thermodesulfobacteriota bacterium]